MKFIDDRQQALCTICSSALLIIGTVLDFANNDADFWFFGAGALIAIVQAFVFAYTHRTSDIRISRLHRINFMSTLTLGIGTYMMATKSNSWVAMLVLYIVLQLFLAFRWKEE